MGDKIKLIFVYPSAGNTVGEIIDFGESISDGQPGVTFNDLPSHTGIVRPDGILESLVDGVVLSPLSSYDGVRITTVEIDVPNLAATREWEPKQIGRPYSFLSCYEAAVFALTGKVINYQQEGCDCSQLAIEDLRIAGLEIFGDRPSALVRPCDLLNELVKMGATVT